MKKHQEIQYLELLRDIMEHGTKKIDRATGDASFSVFGRQLRFDLSEGFPLLTTKKVYWKGVLHELYWFMSGQSNIKYLVDNNVHIWDDYPYRMFKIKNKKSTLTKEEFIEKIKNNAVFAEKWGNLPRIYGELWRRWPCKFQNQNLHGKPCKPGEPSKPRTIDQLQWAINEIVEDPNCHNAIVTSWNPEYLYTMARYQDTSHFPICHNMYQLNVNDNKLSLQLYQRSADIFLGVPFNIASYALLALIICQITGYEPGEFIHTFGDVHIYEMHLEQVKEQLKREPKPLPKVSFTQKFKTIDDFKPEYVLLENYKPHDIIKAQLSVTGGYIGKHKNIYETK
ncbi:MAG: thymidylate synthase [bacterium]|nr:thymidylate synthase [bacterium]